MTMTKTCPEMLTLRGGVSRLWTDHLAEEMGLSKKKLLTVEKNNMTTKKEQKEKVARYLLQGAPLRVLMPTTSAETYRECTALIDYWGSIPWWKFWLKPSFEEQKSIIISKWRSLEDEEL